MPTYPGVGNSLTWVGNNTSGIALQKGESLYLFGVLAAGATQLPVNESNVTFETVAAGQASISIDLQGMMGDPNAVVGIELVFSGAPGIFNAQIQLADTDADGYYATPGDPNYTITSVNANQVAQVNVTPGKRFLRLLMSTLTNAVNTRVKATRAA
jgi:hypothetical protein